MGATLVAMVMATVMPVAIGVLAPQLTTEAGLSSLQLAALPAALYLVGSLLSPRSGAVADALGPRRGTIAMMAVVAVAFVLFAVAPGFVGLVLAVAVSGIALAMSNPVTNNIIIAAFPPGRRGTALGWKQAGVPLAGLVAGAVLPSLAVAIGWRGAMGAVAAAVVLLGAGAVVALGREGAGIAADAAGRTDAAAVPAAEIAGGEPRSGLGSISGLGWLMGAAAGCINTYLVLYAVTQLGYGARIAGLMTAVVGISGALTRIVWARTAESGKGPHHALRIAGPIALAAVLAIATAPVVGGWTVWVGSALAGVGIFAFTALGMLAVIQAVPATGVGRATGTLGRMFYAGLLSGPLLFGGILDVSGSYAAAWGAVAVLMVGAIVLTQVAWRTPVAAETAVRSGTASGT